MRAIPRSLRTGVALLAVSLAAVAPVARAADDAGARLDAAVEGWFEAVLALDPLFATRIGDARYDNRLGDPDGLRTRARRVARDRLALAEVEAIPEAALSEPDRITRAVFIHERRAGLAMQAFPEHLLPITQLDSLATELVVLGSGAGALRFETLADHEAWLARTAEVPRWVDTVIGLMREGMARGVTVPRAPMSRVLPQLDAVAGAASPEASPFWAPVKSLPPTLDAPTRARIEAAYRARIGSDLQPAYRKLRAFIADQYLPACRTTDGWSALPDGAAWYRAHVQMQTGLALSPEEIHALGLVEVARIRGEMDTVRRELGFAGDLDAFIRHLRSDPRFLYPDGAAVLAAYRSVQQHLDAALPALFDLRPQAGYVVREIEAFRADSAPGAAYEAPSADGSRPGIFYVNTANLRAQPTYIRETLTLHEAEPGHHFQVALAQEQAMPRFRRFGWDTAFGEGWALYAESLGPELGLFRDPYQRFGRLDEEMLRATRLVVDTGLHARGWGRERAMAYMRAQGTISADDARVEVERYMVWPAQALAYKLGERTIRGLRTRAEQALGPRFDLRAFHRQVLIDGALPLAVLEAKIERWIRAQQAT